MSAIVRNFRGGDRGNLPSVAAAGTRASALIRGQIADRRALELSSLLKRFRNSAASLREIAAELEARGIPAPRGGSTWLPTQVQRLLTRLDSLAETVNAEIR